MTLRRIQPMVVPTNLKLASQLENALIEKLENENEELRERIIQLEEMLGYSIVVPVELGLTASEAKVLGYLNKVEYASKEGILNALYGDRPNDIPELKIVDVFICKIRGKIRQFGIKIETVWGRGYRLPPQSKSVMLKILKKGSSDEETDIGEAGRIAGGADHEPGAAAVRADTAGRA